MVIINDELVKYEIPKEIDEKIPDYFYAALAGELCSIYGVDIFRKHPNIEYDNDGNEKIDWENYYYDLNSGTGGWINAVFATCERLNMQWLSDYWIGLEWYDSDILDSIIEARIIERFIDNKRNPGESYFQYLINK